MGLYQSSLRTALTTATLNSSRQHASYMNPLLVKHPQQPYSRGYHYESTNHSVYVQMPHGRPGQVVLPLHPSPFASSNPGGQQNTDPKAAFDQMVKEQIGETFDPRLAGLCVDVMKDPDVIDSILKNPAFQELADELALEVVSSNETEELLHLPELEKSSSLALESKGDQSGHGAELLPPAVDTKEVGEEEEEEEQTPPLPPLETRKEKKDQVAPNRGDDETNRILEEKEDVNKIAEGVVGVVCGNCHQPLPRLDLSQESMLSEEFVGDIVAAPPPPPPQNMERVWKSIQSQSDLLTLVIPIVTVALMIGIMCIRPGVRQRVGAILKSSFSKLRSAIFAFGPWRRALRR